MEILSKAKTVTANLQTSDGLLESFLICLTDTHDFTYGTHLCTKLVLCILKFLKCPSCEFDYDIISAGNILIKCSVYTTRDLIQCKSARKHCRYQSDGETCCLGSKCGRTGCSGVDLNDNDSVCHRIMCELYVGTTDNLYFVNNLVSLLLKTLLALFRNGKHGSGTERVTGMNTQRIDVLDETYSDHVSLSITNNFQLQLFPAKNGLFYQYLSYKAGLKTTCTNSL